MNFYGLDKQMHRGLLIVRSDLTTEVIRSFDTSLQHRFRIAKMKNPNVYDGNDPRADGGEQQRAPSTAARWWATPTSSPRTRTGHRSTSIRCRTPTAT